MDEANMEADGGQQERQAKNEKLWKAYPPETYRNTIAELVHFSSKTVNSNAALAGVRLASDDALDAPYVSARTLMARGVSLSLDYGKGGAFEGLYRISWRPLTPEDQENPFGTDAFPKVVVTPLPIMRNDGPETEALVRATKEILAEYAHTNKKLTPEILSAVSALRDPGQLADTILPLLKIEYPKKQEALELADPGQRLEKVYEFLNTEMERVSMERRIKSRVKDQMDKNQREYYLSEQIKAINKEMGREDDPQAEIAELEQMLKAKNMPEEAREKGMSELKKLRMMAPASAEYAIVRNYVDWILELPWNDMRETSIDIPEARAILDADHFGLEKPKQRILEFLAVQKLTNALKGPILCLVGPPGVGKTSLARSVATATGRAPFF